MKKELLMTLMFLSVLSISSQAGTSEIFQKVLTQDEVQSLTNIDKIEVTEVYKCPSCFEITVSGLKEGLGDGSLINSTLIFETKGDLFSNETKVELISF